MIELTGFTKSGGPLTKRITLGDDGKSKSDATACIMPTGAGRRVRIASVDDFAALIGTLKSHEAVALGALRPDLSDEVKMTTKLKLDALNGTAAPNLIARTSEHISYRDGRRALALIDYDTKGMPPAVAQRIAALGGFVPALHAILPELATAATITRAPTSSGLFRADTGERFIGSGGGTCSC